MQMKTMAAIHFSGGTLPLLIGSGDARFFALRQFATVTHFTSDTYDLLRLTLRISILHLIPIGIRRKLNVESLLKTTMTKFFSD